jgi:hypothetical protein
MIGDLEQRLTGIEELLREVLASVGGDRLMTETEAAELRGLSIHTLRRERFEGRGPTFIKDPHTGAVRYRRGDVRAYVARGEVQPNRKNEPNLSALKSITGGRR